MSKQLKKHMFALQWAARWLHKILVQKNYQGLKDKCSRPVERQWRHGFCEEFVQPPCGAFGGSGTCHNRSIPSAACEPRQPWVSHRFRRKKRYWFLSEKPPTTRGHRNRRPSSSLLRWRGCVYGDFWAAVNLFDSKRGRHATSFGCFRWNFPLKKKEMVPFQGRRYVRQQFRGGRGGLRLWRNMDRTFLPWNSHLHIMGSSPSRQVIRKDLPWCPMMKVARIHRNGLLLGGLWKGVWPHVQYGIKLFTYKSPPMRFLWWCFWFWCWFSILTLYIRKYNHLL